MATIAKYCYKLGENQNITSLFFHNQMVAFCYLILKEGIFLFSPGFVAEILIVVRACRLCLCKQNEFCENLLEYEKKKTIGRNKNFLMDWRPIGPLYARACFPLGSTPYAKQDFF